VFTVSNKRMIVRKSSLFIYLLANMPVCYNGRKKYQTFHFSLMHGCNSHDSLICIDAISDIVCVVTVAITNGGLINGDMDDSLRYLFIFLVELDIKFQGFFYDP
jgi:hypothetical protein